jgi:uncharacterized Fe-S center protein
MTTKITPTMPDGRDVVTTWAREIPRSRVDDVASRDGIVVSRVVAEAGDYAVRRFLEFFAAAARNKNARMAYCRAICQFSHWCDCNRIHAGAYRPARLHCALNETAPR